MGAQAPQVPPANHPARHLPRDAEPPNPTRVKEVIDMAKSIFKHTPNPEMPPRQTPAPIPPCRLRLRPLACPLPLLLLLPVLLLAAGCKKNEPPAEAPKLAAQPGQTAPAAAQPTGPVPAFSAAQQIGMFVYPKNNQTHDQQLIDESACYNSVQQQTGINPQGPAPSGPTAAQQQAAAQQGAADASQEQGGGMRGAARGAAGGAMLGAIGGHAGRGAAIGGAIGTVRGRRRQREANEEAQQQGAQSADAQQQQAYAQDKAAYNKQIATFKRGFTACMEARNYSVQ